MGPAGRVPAFDSIVERWRLPAYRLAMRYIGDPAEAEDVTQEIFVQLYRRLDRYDTDRPFGPWFWTLATNVCRNYRRRRRMALPEELSNQVFGTPQPSPESDLVVALACLRPGQRRALLLHHHMGFSIVETAQRMGVSDSAVKSRLHRARASLRRALSGADLSRVA